MTSEIEGRWRLVFQGAQHTDLKGNEFVLAEGIVSLAQTGQAIGTYETDEQSLALTLPTLVDDGEGQWRMIIRVISSAWRSNADNLPGRADAVAEDGTLISTKGCSLVRIETNS